MKHFRRKSKKITKSLVQSHHIYITRNVPFVKLIGDSKFRMSHMSHTIVIITEIKNVTPNVNEKQFQINKKLISFLMNTCVNFILKVLMVSQITFSYVKLLLQNKRGRSNIFLRFINNITLSQDIETNLIELGLVKTDSKISKTRSKIKLLTILK